MSNGRIFSRRNVAWAIALGILAMLAGWLVWYTFFTGTPVKPAPQRPLPPAADNGPLKQTDLQQAIEALGPFQTITVDTDTPTPDTHSPAVLLIKQDGSTQASTKWSVPFSADQWSPGFATNITSQSAPASGYVTFGTGLQRTYTVKCGQPFFFEERPQNLYVIDAQGKQWSITTARAEILRKSL